MIKLIALTITLLLTSTIMASAEEKVRVLVMDDLPSLTLHIPDDYEVRDDTGGKSVTRAQGGSEVVLGKGGGGDAGVRILAGDSVVNVENFALTGVIDVTKNSKGLYRIINVIGLEDYTRAVIGEEMPSGWPIEALKAQAVVARTYTLYRKRASKAADYDLCSTVNSQMFAGDGREKEGPARAVRETEGEVLTTYQGEPIEALYHASCGGSTEDASEVWDREAPYLKSRNCPCNEISPFSRWTKGFSADDMETALRRDGYEVFGVSCVKVVKKSRSGRAKMVRIDGDTGSVSVKANDLRRILGYNALPSAMFEVKRQNGGFVFTGRGSGHGVGMCQWGAKELAGEGLSYAEILARYYPGTKITNLKDK